MLKCNSNVNEHERSRSRNGNGHIKRQRFAPASAPFIPFFVSSPPPPDFRPRPTGCGCKTRTHSGPQKDSHPHPQWQPQPHNHEPIQPYIQRQDISRESKKLAKRRMCADESQTNLSHARIWQPRVPTSPLSHRLATLSRFSPTPPNRGSLSLLSPKNQLRCRPRHRAPSIHSRKKVLKNSRSVLLYVHLLVIFRFLQYT